MEEILNQPLPELENKSWIQSFRCAVREASEKLERQGMVPKVILVTGGASRMKFARQICAEIFPEPETQVRPDSEPERCIALGLARVGRWDLRAAAFQREVNNLLSSNKLKNLIERHIPELIELLTKPLADGLIENAVKLCLKNWQKNQIRTLTDLEVSMKKLAEEWLNSADAQQIINERCARWFNSKIQADLAAETDPICRQFQIPRSSLRFDEGIDTAFVNPELRIGDAILADTVAVILNVLIGGSTIGSLIMVILTGHLTLPIALVYGASVLAAGMELTKNSIKDTIKTTVDIPSWLRSSFLSDSKIDSICQQMHPELEKVLKEQLTGKQDAFDELIAKVGQRLILALSTKVQEAVILIQ
jgi:molecular chaperone DnaK (HSP70)